MPRLDDTNEPRTQPEAQRQANDSGDPALEIDRDVHARPMRERGDLIDSTEAPVPPVPVPNNADYENDPTSKNSDDKAE